MYTCALCGKSFDTTKLFYIRGCNYYGCAYLERGISQKHYLCLECYDKKILISDLSGDEKKRQDAIEDVRKKIEDKSPVMQEIVDAWIDGEEKNYYSNVNGLVYYIKGPLASLFVFKDHLTILTAFGPRDKDVSIQDYVMFYKCKGLVDYGEVREVKNHFFLCERGFSDLEKVNGEINTETANRWATKPTQVELNISLGGRGTLDFDENYYSFEFYYHQNQLMEEVFHYIKKRMTNPDVEDDVVQVTDNMKQASQKQTEKKEETVVTYSPAEEIRKMKELFDCGILSQEEFDEAKKRLIGKL